MTQSPDLSYYRRYFPSLDLEFEGKKAIYFDNPGGTTGYRCDGNLFP